MIEVQNNHAILDPRTSKKISNDAGELYVEVTALKVYNAGSKFSSDQVVFKCPYCGQRNRRNIRFAVAMTRDNVAALKCVCRRLVYVRKPASTQKVVLAG